MSEVIASKKERLKKIYTLSKEVPFVDEDGEFSLYIRKLTPVEERDARQESLRVKATLLAIEKEDNNSPIKMGFRDLIESIGLDDKDSLVRYVCAEDLVKLQESIESRIAFEDKWAENDYLAALQDAWVGGMREAWELNNEDEEASRVFNALKEYTLEVAEALEAESEDILAAKEDWSIEKLMNAATDKFIQKHAATLQYEEYDMWRIFYCTYEDSSLKERFFSSRKELDDYPEIVERLRSEYDSISLSVIEGKD